MSDSDISKILLRNTYPQNINSERAGENGYTPAKLVSIPDHVREHHPDKVSGKVIRHDRERNLVVISTDEGERIVVQTDKKFSVEDGQRVEIKLDLSHVKPDTTSYIRISPNPALPLPSVPIDHISTSSGLPYTPPKIQPQSSVEILILSPSQIKNIRPLAPQFISLVSLPQFEFTLTDPFKEFLLPSLQANSFDIQTISPEVIIYQPTQPNFSFTEDISQHTLYSLQQLPMKSVIARLIKINPEQLLHVDPTAPPDFHHFKSGTLHSVNETNTNQHILFDKQFAEVPLYAFAGEAEMKLIGYTPEMDFPVLERTHPPSDDEKFIVALNGSFEHMQEHSVFVVSPTFEKPMSSTIPLPAPFSHASLLFQQHIWSSLDDIFQTLQMHAPVQAQNLSALIPNASAPMRGAHGALFFIAALRSGDVQSWMGEKTIDTLKRAGKSELLTRFFKEISDISLSNDSSSEWKSSTLPYLHDQHIYRINIHSRKEYPQQDTQEKKGGTTRFIIELSLSNMGKIQLDGLFQGNEQQNIGRLDLIVRTQNPFSKSSQFQMRELYSNALRETNFTGELAFQSDPDQWVHISPHQISERFSEKI